MNSQQNNYSIIKYTDSNQIEREVRPSSEQLKIITSDIFEDQKIIACAGSGKTTTLVFRLKYLIDQGVNPESILVSAYNVEAGKNLKIRAKEIIGEQYSTKMLIGNIDKIAFKFYNDYIGKNEGEIQIKLSVKQFCSKLQQYLQTPEGEQNIINKYKYFFFDEFQDANQLQYDILMLFKKKGCNLVVIGIQIFTHNDMVFDNSILYLLQVMTHKAYTDGEIQKQNLYKLLLIKMQNQLLVKTQRSISSLQTIDAQNPLLYSPIKLLQTQNIQSKKEFNEKKPDLLVYDHLTHQIKSIIKQIKNLKYEYSLCEMAVLSPTNQPLRFFEEILEKNNQKKSEMIPYTCRCSSYQDFYSKNTKDKLNQTKLTLSTLHSAKGLEWKIVFFIGINDSYFPGDFLQEQGQYVQKLEECRRLFYVGCTRASQHLHFSVTRQKEKRNPPIVCRFFNDIDKKYYQIDNKLTEQDFSKAKEGIQFIFKVEQNYKGLEIQTAITKIIESFEYSDHNEADKFLKGIKQFNNQQIHKKTKFRYDQLEENRLFQDLGLYIDLLLQRTLAEVYDDSNGYKYRFAEEVLFSIHWATSRGKIVEKYSDFFKAMDLDTDEDEDLIDELEFFYKTAKKEIIKIDQTEEQILKDIQVQIQKFMYKYGIKYKQIYHQVLKGKKDRVSEYFPEEFDNRPYIESYKRFCDNKIKTNDILKDIYNISKCGMLVNLIRRSLYRDDFQILSPQDLISNNDEFLKFLKKQSFKKVEVKKVVNDDNLVGEIDFIADDTIFEIKSSQSKEIQKEYILQALAYASLLRKQGKEVKSIAFYNPIQGSVYFYDIEKWNLEKEFTDFLYQKSIEKAKSKLNQNDTILLENQSEEMKEDAQEIDILQNVDIENQKDLIQKEDEEDIEDQDEDNRSGKDENQLNNYEVNTSLSEDNQEDFLQEEEQKKENNNNIFSEYIPGLQQKYHHQQDSEKQLELIVNKQQEQQIVQEDQEQLIQVEKDFIHSLQPIDFKKQQYYNNNQNQNQMKLNQYLQKNDDIKEIIINSSESEQQQNENSENLIEVNSQNSIRKQLDQKEEINKQYEQFDFDELDQLHLLQNQLDYDTFIFQQQTKRRRINLYSDNDKFEQTERKQGSQIQNIEYTQNERREFDFPSYSFSQICEQQRIHSLLQNDKIQDEQFLNQTKQFQFYSQNEYNSQNMSSYQYKNYFRNIKKQLIQDQDQQDYNFNSHNEFSQINSIQSEMKQNILVEEESNLDTSIIEQIDLKQNQKVKQQQLKIQKDQNNSLFQINNNINHEEFNLKEDIIQDSDCQIISQMYDDENSQIEFIQDQCSKNKQKFQKSIQCEIDQKTKNDHINDKKLKQQNLDQIQYNEILNQKQLIYQNIIDKNNNNKLQVESNLQKIQQQQDYISTKNEQINQSKKTIKNKLKNQKKLKTKKNQNQKEKIVLENEFQMQNYIEIVDDSDTKNNKKIEVISVDQQQINYMVQNLFGYFENIYKKQANETNKLNEQVQEIKQYLKSLSNHLNIKDLSQEQNPNQKQEQLEVEKNIQQLQYQMDTNNNENNLNTIIYEKQVNVAIPQFKINSNKLQDEISLSDQKNKSNGQKHQINKHFNELLMPDLNERPINNEKQQNLFLQTQNNQNQIDKQFQQLLQKNKMQVQDSNNNIKSKRPYLDQNYLIPQTQLRKESDLFQNNNENISLQPTILCLDIEEVKTSRDLSDIPSENPLSFRNSANLSQYHDPSILCKINNLVENNIIQYKKERENKTTTIDNSKRKGTTDIQIYEEITSKKQKQNNDLARKQQIISFFELFFTLLVIFFIFHNPNKTKL